MKMNLFSIILRLNGYPIQRASALVSELNKHSFIEAENWRNRKRQEIFLHHYKNNTTYFKGVRSSLGHDPVDWSEIPVLTKSDLQRPLNEMLTKNVRQLQVYVSNTSGSSGHPFYFAKDKFCHAMTWAVNIDRYKLHDINYGNSLQARFYGISLDKRKGLSEKTKDFISARKRFDVFDLSDPALEKFIEKFSNTKFEYINGYTSVLVVFAEYLIRKGVLLKQVCPTLKVTITTSEVLNESDRSLLINGFGVPVVNEYGASELDIIAFEDKDYDWIINNENLWVEIVDEQGQPLPDGEEGRIVITSLHNKAMPFIRYEIGDVGSISKHRKGNYQILQSLQGRINDIALLPSGKKAPGLTFYYVSKKLLEQGGCIKEFIIKQRSASNFHFEYVADNELNQDQRRQISIALDQYLEPGLIATFERKPKIDRTRIGKLMHFQREF